MIKFSFLSILASLACMVAGTAIFFFGFSSIPYKHDSVLYAALENAVTYGAFFMFGMGAVGLLFVTPISLFGIELRESGRYGFKQNGLGRELAKTFQNEQGQATFCKMWATLSMILLLLVFVVVMIVALVVVLFWVESNPTPTVAAESHWLTQITEMLVTFLYVVVPLIALGYIGRFLRNTWLDQWHKRHVCPIVETD